MNRNTLAIGALIVAVCMFAGAITYAVYIGISNQGKLGGVAQAGPCRHALAMNLPPTISIGSAVDDLLSDPNSARSVQIRAAVNRAVKDQECEDQAFLVCAAIAGEDYCIPALAKQTGREVVGAHGHSLPSGQPGPATGGAHGGLNRGNGAGSPKPPTRSPPVNVTTPSLPLLDKPSLCVPGVASLNC
jgi:hypothetical protein